MTAPARYRLVPQEVEAVQWTGGNGPEVMGFTIQIPPAWIVDAEGRLLLNNVIMPVGTWVVRDANYRMWPVSNEEFARWYEPVSGNGR